MAKLYLCNLLLGLHGVLYFSVIILLSSQEALASLLTWRKEGNRLYVR